MPLSTPLHDRHVALGACMVDFGGWNMPLHYGSQVEEHHAVRREAGLFDVSHMCALDVRGPAARAYLRHVLANDVQRLQAPGKALYSCLLDERGGVIDDLIACFVDEQWFRVVVNAGTATKDLAWLRACATGFDVSIDERRDLAMVAVQGPRARERAAQVLGDAAAAALGLGTFFGAQFGDCFVARTGYTGEDGFEIALPAARAPAFWDALVAAGVRPCGLGARDTLRLEAGMNLYGSDMDERVTPLECGLAWTVSLADPARDFIGRAALEAQQAAGVARRQVGLLLEDKGVLRSHQRVVVPGADDGEVTSGTWSPTLGRSIALARVSATAADRVQVDVRGRLLAARVVRPPFVRHGRAQVPL